MQTIKSNTFVKDIPTNMDRNQDQKDLYLNIGSGQRPFKKPWINIDSQAKFNPCILGRAEDILPNYNNQVQAICLHHVIEHFGCGESLPLLYACYRALVPGGFLIVSVPNMFELASMFLQGKISTQVYMTNVYGAYMESEDDRHKWGYTRSSLWSLLQQAGFHNSTTIQRANLLPALPSTEDIAFDDWILVQVAQKSETYYDLA